MATSRQDFGFTSHLKNRASERCTCPLIHCWGIDSARAERVSPTESQIPLARAVFLLCVTSNQHSTILTAARKADNIFFQGTKI